MKTLFAKLTARARRSLHRGQTLVEYSLILAIISVFMIAVMTLLGNKVVIVFSAVSDLLDTAQASH
jgi:Flp pilus assembly pilin Flp